MPSYLILCNLTSGGADATVQGTLSPADQITDAIAQIDPTPQLRVWWTKGPYGLVALVEGIDDDRELHAALLALAGRGTLRTTTLPAIESTGIDDVIARANVIDGHIRGGHIRGGTDVAGGGSP